MILETKYRALLNAAERRDGVDAGGLRLCLSILSLAAAIDRDCAQRLAPHRLSESRFLILCLLHDAPEGLSPHRLADLAGVTRATITGLVDGMERDGLLARHRDDPDRRKLTLRLTGPGARLAAELAESHTRWIGDLAGDLDFIERAALLRLLERVRAQTGAAA